MRFLRARRAQLLAILLVGAIMIGGLVWRLSFISALDNLAVRGTADLSLVTAGLTGHLERYREFAVLLSDHPVLLARLRNAAPVGADAPEAAGTLLLSVADETGVLNIILLDASGHVQAAADPQAAALTEHAGTSYFKRAMHGALGSFHGILAGSGQRIFTFAAPVYSAGGPPLGAVVIVVDPERLESGWRADASSFFFTDDLGVVFLANRTELVLTAMKAQIGSDAFSGTYGAVALHVFPGFRAQSLGHHELWHVPGWPYLPDTALHLSRYLPVFGLTGHLLLDTAPARRVSFLQAALAVTVYAGLVASWALVTARRRRLTDRLAQEASAKTVLESRVAERTRALSLANDLLRLEVAERHRAEQSLLAAQARLVQAEKLSALGQMSAGISHELNQPLMAMLSYADNTEVLIARGKYDVAATNIARISEMARRMGRIIKNLRAFARQEDAPLSDVDAGAVIEAALELTEARRLRHGVTLSWTPPDTALKVRAGEVRLQQVIVNLISNAVDAMEQSPLRHIDISVGVAEDQHVAVKVRDTGPGIKEPERIFDPFYSTKQVSHDDSMGLGLSISYGLVQSFGGDISGANAPEGGAVFTVRLARAGGEATQ